MSGAVQITVNGEPREIVAGTTVKQLVLELGLGEGPVAVERNRDVVPRRLHGETALVAGDVVEIVHFVGGG